MRAAVIAMTLLTAACGEAPQVTVYPSDNPPDRLSDWGVVHSNGRYFELNEHAIPYDLNTPLFSDYALKLRSVWMPEGESATYSEPGEFGFPVGTILSKTFHYEQAGTGSAVLKEDRESKLDAQGRLELDDYVLVETRLLVRYEDGWRALPYVWNEGQDEAFLELAGEVRSFEFDVAGSTEPVVYVVPDANQCAGCHAADHGTKALKPLGPIAWQLNRDYRYGVEIGNQLVRWSRAGKLSGTPQDLPTGVSWHAPGDASIEDRARAYLDVNCAHCHNAEGPADTSALDLSIGAPVDRGYGICKPPVAVGRGSGDRPYDIYPGRPDDSILVYRMEHNDPAIAMPELGRGTVHTEGTALVRQWIAGMSGEC